MQQSISDIAVVPRFVFYQDEVEFYIPLDHILFLETSDNRVNAHTADEMYQIKFRLYELERILPTYFMRVSKSTIININYIYSIDRNITSSSMIRFYKSHKQVFVSRMYYKILKQRLEEGLFFILAAVLIVVNQLGFLEGISLLHLLITIVLIPIIIKSISYLNFGGILLPLAVIGILYAEPLGIQAFTPWQILIIALFSSIGLSFIFPHRFLHGKRCGNCKGNSHTQEGFEEVIDVPDDSIVDVSVRMGASVKYVNTQNLTRANLQCSFGALKVYFDHATVGKEGAIIALDISFSGVELYLPKEWHITDKTNTVIGSIEEKNARGNQEGPTITLIGKTSFSGIEIIYIYNGK